MTWVLPSRVLFLHLPWYSDCCLGSIWWGAHIVLMNGHQVPSHVHQHTAAFELTPVPTHIVSLARASISRSHLQPSHIVGGKGKLTCNDSIVPSVRHMICSMFFAACPLTWFRNVWRLTSARRSNLKAASGSSHPNDSQAQQLHHPAAIEEYLRELDRYRAFLAGQPREIPSRGRKMARYIEDWERKWKHLTGEGTAQGRWPNERDTNVFVGNNIIGKPKL